MAEARRTLKEEFRDYIDRRDAWPGYKQLRPVVKFKNDAYLNLKQGLPVSEKLVMALVRNLLVPDGPDRELRQRAELPKYLQRAGVSNPTAASDEELLAAVCLPVSDSVHTDFLQRGFGGIVEFLRGQFTRHITTRVQACRDEDDVRLAIRWMYIAAGRYHAEQPTLPESEAVSVANALMRIDLSDYQLRAVAWWRKEPWTVVLVRAGRRPTGMTLVLPLKTQAYEALLAGAWPSYDCLPEHLAVPSNCILIEGCAERPTAFGSGPSSASRAVYYVVMAQICALARSARLTDGQALHMLCFTASELARKRLLAYGFEPTGRNMARTGVEYLERRLLRSFDSSNLLPRAVIDMLGLLLSRTPPE